MPSKFGRNTIAAAGILALGHPVLSTPALAEPPAAKPSFDCANAHSVADHLICDDPKLSAMDAEYAAAYKRALAASPDRENFLRSGLAAWKRRNQCMVAACLNDWYATRNRDFAASTDSAPAPPTAEDHSNAKFAFATNDALLARAMGMRRRILAVARTHGDDEDAFCVRMNTTMSHAVAFSMAIEDSGGTAEGAIQSMYGLDRVLKQ